MALTALEPPTTRNLPRKDYVGLNSGLGRSILTPQHIEHIEQIEQIEHSFSPETIGHDDSEGPLPSESISQVSSSSSSVLTAASRELCHSIYSSTGDICVKRRKIHTSWTQDHFWVTILDTQWSKKGQQPQYDRLFVCKRCNWSSSDSSRHGTTSNLLTHLRTRHRVGPELPSSETLSRGPLDLLLRPRQESPNLEQALIRWVIQTRQPFTTVEHPSFKAIFDAVAIEPPLRCADTLRDRISNEFGDHRQSLKQELARTCGGLAISIDTWTAEHQLSVVAIIGHWVTPSFEKREALLDFIELPGPHSGENMAAVVLAMLHELELGSKLLTITGDNAGNNGTICDALYTELSKLYDDEDGEFRLRPLMRFHGRTSFIRCLAHVINLICKDILHQLGTGSVREAKTKLDRGSAKSRWHVEAVTSTLEGENAISKIRLLVLWMSRSPQRLQDWREVSPRKMINYDVETRWNSTYTMIADAIRLRKELNQFVRTHAEVEALLPTDKDWLQLEQIQTILKPFWEYTNVVSRDLPTIADSLVIYWSLDDLLNHASTAQGDFHGVDPSIQEAVQHALGKAEKFLRKMDENILYYVATALDPRIKGSLVNAHMSSDDACLITSQVCSFLKNEYPLSGVEQPEPQQPAGMPDSLWKTLKRLQPGTSRPTSDVDRYLDSATVGWSHGGAEEGTVGWVLQWWKANAFEFPSMARAARDYLAVPSTEVGVERVFSGARDVLGLRRHSMSAETMRWLVLLKSHYDRGL